MFLYTISKITIIFLLALESKSLRNLWNLGLRKIYQLAKQVMSLNFIVQSENVFYKYEL